VETKRTLAFITLTARVLATAPLRASATQIVEDFAISVSGDADQHFLSTPFDLFRPLDGDRCSASASP
jgi:hypothetical protein